MAGCGLTSGWLSAEAAVAFLGEERRDAERAAGTCQPGAPARSTLWNSAAFGAARKSCNGCRGGTPGCPPHERRRPPTSSTELQSLADHARGVGTRRWPASRPQVLGGERRRRAPAADGSLVNAFARAGRSHGVHSRPPQASGDQGDAGSCDPNWGQSVSPPAVVPVRRGTTASGVGHPCEHGVRHEHGREAFTGCPARQSP